MLADELDYVIGVDTHRDEHALAVVACPSGGGLAEALIGADERGYAAALALAEEQAPGRRAWAIEGTGSYGKGLARYLAERGERLYELERPSSMPCARPAGCWPRGAQPRPGSPASARRCASCSRSEQARWRHARSRSASCGHCWSPAPSRCGPSCAR